MLNEGLLTISEKSELANRGINSYIKDGIDYYLEKLKTDPKTQMEVGNDFIKKKVSKKVENDFDISEVDLGMEVRGFINFQRSEQTKRNYGIWINSFLDYCMGKEINPLKVKREEVESYFVYLSEGNSPNSYKVENNVGVFVL